MKTYRRDFIKTTLGNATVKANSKEEAEELFNNLDIEIEENDHNTEYEWKETNEEGEQ